MLNLKILIFLATLHVNYRWLQAATSEGPVVYTKIGKVRGEAVTNGVSCTYYAFRSIPYAEPPTGDLRFEPPVRISKRYTRVLDATVEAPTCLQLFQIGNESRVLGTEDCLYLNIFTPKLGKGKTQYLPVMVFLHGGDFMRGNSNFFGEQSIMANGKMILVTVAYRLNVFGFLSTEDDVIPGNMGLKDQTVALRWIYKNIGFFGGSKKHILLSGWQAGGASVNYHMVSKYTSADLFYSAASFSGVAIAPQYTIYPGEASKKARLLAEYLKCPYMELSSHKGISSCLKRRAADEIVLQIPKFFHFAQKPMNIFGPVLETQKRSNKNFLTQHVLSLMADGKSKHKPWLITRTSDDGAVIAAEFLKKDSNGLEEIYQLKEHWNEWAPTLLLMDPRLTNRERLVRALKYKQEYFGNQDITLERYKDLERMLNDELSTEYVQKTAKIFAGRTRHSETYGYIYDNPPPFGLGQLNSQRDDLTFGTLHGDDMFIIFNTTLRLSHPYRDDEKLIKTDLIDMLVTFAKTG